LQDIGEALKGLFKGVVFLASSHHNAVSLLSTVSPDFASRFNAGKLIQAAASHVDGKGGGRPDMARGAGRNSAGVPQALEAVKKVLSSSV
jgi:alanyl-tRNA synthetase